MIWETDRSFPGMGVAAMTTMSPSSTRTCLCSRAAMSDNADSGSPWLPVLKMRTSDGA